MLLLSSLSSISWPVRRENGVEVKGEVGECGDDARIGWDAIWRSGCQSTARERERAFGNAVSQCLRRCEVAAASSADQATSPAQTLKREPNEPEKSLDCQTIDR